MGVDVAMELGPLVAKVKSYLASSAPPTPAEPRGPEHSPRPPERRNGATPVQWNFSQPPEIRQGNRYAACLSQVEEELQRLGTEGYLANIDEVERLGGVRYELDAAAPPPPPTEARPSPARADSASVEFWRTLSGP